MRMIRDGDRISIGEAKAPAERASLLRDTLKARLRSVDTVLTLGCRNDQNDSEPYQAIATADVFADIWYERTGEAVFYAVSARYAHTPDQAVCSVQRLTLTEMCAYQRSLYALRGEAMLGRDPDRFRVYTYVLELDSLRQPNLSEWFGTLSDREQAMLFSNPNPWLHKDLLTKLKPLDLARALEVGGPFLRERVIRLLGRLNSEQTNSAEPRPSPGV